MKKRIIIGVVVALVAVAFLWHHFRSFDDVQIRGNLPGTWVVVEPSGLSDSFIVRRDGSYVAEFKNNKGRVSATHEGRFKVTNGYLIVSVTQSSLTNQLVPRDFRHRIIHANAQEMVFDDGTIFRKNLK